MNRNVMIVLAGGFLIAVLVALLVQASLSGGKKKQAPTEVKEEPKVEIIVAVKSLGVGAELNDSNMKWQSWPKNAVFPGAVVRKEGQKVSEALTGRLRRAVSEGEPIIASALVPSDQPNFLAASLQPGMRAVSVDVSTSSIVSGFVGPGDYVDVILIYQERIRYEGENPEVAQYIENTIDSMATETIMKNIKVLAVDQTATRAADDKVKAGKTVTLEVDKRGSETLALASRMGEISLVLRGIGDDKVAGQAYPVITDARLMSIDDEVWQEMSKKENKSSQNTNIVRIYKGGEMKEMAVSP